MIARIPPFRTMLILRPVPAFECQAPRNDLRGEQRHAWPRLWTTPASLSENCSAETMANIEKATGTVLRRHGWGQ